MGKQPVHQAFIQAARRLVVLTIIVVLAVAPLVVSLTHGPEIDDVSNSSVEDVASHGHIHVPGGDGHKHAPASGHNPADHDHQLQALIHPAASEPKPPLFRASRALSDTFRNLIPEGPRRPPRLV